MTLTELVTVMAITSVVLTMLGTVMVSLAKQNGINLARQQTVDSMRVASDWLSEALDHAASDPDDIEGSVFTLAQAKKMVFTSALEDSDQTRRLVSRVMLVLGEECWSGKKAEPDVLRRCIQRPFIKPDGAASWCTPGAKDCPAQLFDETVLARSVKNQGVFSYALEVSPGAEGMMAPIPASFLSQIAAVEVNITMKGDPASSGDKVESTLIKRHNVKGWRKL
ncbi:MAG: hypothetical protein LBH48_00670 [Bifidobacteriaceae bacterium]|jgi:hypothetical protein|nr:hypothetical protein [Bifidobacteriaceae bacterium]